MGLAPELQLCGKTARCWRFLSVRIEREPSNTVSRALASTSSTVLHCHHHWPEISRMHSLENEFTGAGVHLLAVELTSREGSGSCSMKSPPARPSRTWNWHAEPLLLGVLGQSGAPVHAIRYHFGFLVTGSWLAMEALGDLPATCA